MSYLKRLAKELYAKEPSEEVGAPRPKIFREPPKKEEPPLPEEVEAKPKMRGLSKKGRLVIIFVSIGVLTVAGIILFFLLRQYYLQVVPQEKIYFNAEAPGSLISGQEFDYRFTIKNESHVHWQNVEVDISYPQGFAFLSSNKPPVDKELNNSWRLGILAKGAEDVLIIHGKLTGEEGAEAVASAVLSLSPQNSSKIFKRTISKSIVITAVPIAFDLSEVPEFAASGEPIEYLLQYNNLGDADLENLEIVLEYPSGFTFVSSDPPPTKGNNVWEIGVLRKNDPRSLRIKGNIFGNPDEKKRIIAKINKISEEGALLSLITREDYTIIAKQALVVGQSFNDNKAEEQVINPGDSIKGKIFYQNTGNVGLREAIITLKLEGAALDLEKVKTQEGHFDSRTQTITWTSAGVPSLKVLNPGQEGELNFEFAVQKNIAVDSLEDENYSLVAISTIDSPDIPTPIRAPKEISTSRTVLKINTVLELEAVTFYDDGRNGVTKSSGPLPPKVGETTTYTIRWRLKNRTNGVKNVVVTATLAPGVSWTEKKLVNYGEDVVFNARTGQVTWTLGSVHSNAGYLLPVPEAFFQVAIVPSAHQVDQSVDLVKTSTASGVDIFTGQEIISEAKGLSIADADKEKGKVIP